MSARGVATALGKGLGLGAILVAALAGATLAHLDSRGGRALLAAGATEGLRGAFRGRVLVDRVGGVGRRGVTGVDARVLSEQGVTLLDARGVSMRLDVPALASMALTGSGPLRVGIDQLALDHVEVSLDRDASGGLALGEALAARKVSEAPSGPAPSVRVGAIRVQHAWVHGRLADAFALDAELSADAELEQSDAGLTLAVRRLDAHLREARPRADLQLGARASLALRPGQPLALNVGGVGTLARIPLAFDARLRGDELRARLAVPPTAGAHLADLVPDVTVHAPLALGAEVAGNLAPGRVHLVSVAHARAGAGVAEVYADVRVGDTLDLVSGARVRGVELTTFAPGAPSSRLGADAIVRLTVPLRPGALGPHGTLQAELAPAAEVAGIALPPTTATAKLDAHGGLVADAHAREPGLETKAHAELAKGAPLTFAATSALDLATFTRFGALGRGRGALTASGSLDLGTLALAAEARVRASGLESAGLRLASLSAEAEAKGSARAPSVALRTSGAGLRVGKRTPARKAGNPEGVGVDALSASTQLVFGDGVVARGTRVTASTGAERLELTAPELRVKGDAVDLPHAEVTGLGKVLDASFTRRGARLSTRAHAEDLDLGRVARLLGIAELAGHVRADVDLAIEGRDLEGRARVGLLRGSLPGFESASAEVSAELADRKAQVHAELALGTALVSHLQVNQARLSGPALEPASWLTADLGGAFDAEGELAMLSALPQAASLPFVVLGGRLRAVGGFSHDARSGAALPSVDLALSTRGLRVQHGRQVLAGLELEGEVRVDGATGFVAASTRARDAHGALASADVKGRAPLAALVAGASRKELQDAWLAEPLGAHVVVPPRRLADAPASLGLAEAGGTLALEATLEGTPLAPQFRLEARAVDTRLRGAALSTSGVVSATYDGQVATLLATTTAGPGTARVEAHLDAAIGRLLSGTAPAELPWRAGGSATFTRFPLASLPSGAEAKRLGGQLDGRVALRDLHQDAALTVDLDVRDLALGEAQVERVAVHGRAGGGRAELVTRVDQSDGSAELRADLGLAWGARVVPELDRRQKLSAALAAKNLRLAVFAPFTAGVLADLDGRLDADARVSAAGDGSHLVATGHLAARDGSFFVTALGQELHGVGAKVTLLPDGTVRLDEVRATDGVTGQLVGAGLAHLHDLELVDARGALRVPKSSPFELVADGQALGEAYGDVQILARNDPQTNTLAVGITVPTLHVKLADTAGRSVQELHAREDLHIGVLRRGRFAPVVLGPVKDGGVEAADPTAPHARARSVNVAVKLGSDVELRSGSALAVKVTGEPSLHVAGGKTAVGGQIQLSGGSVDIRGKKFTVDRGTLTFGADPSNPVVVASASWLARDKTRVIADFVGPVRGGKLRLHAEPALSESEILALIVFGSADGLAAQTGQRDKSTSTTLAQVGLGMVLGDLGGDTVQTRIDTSSSDHPRPEVELRITPKISLRFAYVLGSPPPSEPDKQLDTVIYRFLPTWSVSATVGDKGKATLDTVWEVRY